MFKKLRNRLLLLNMIVISIVMIAAFAVIYFITYTNIQKENESKLESIPTVARLYEIGIMQSRRNISLVRIPVDYSLSFSILLDSEGQVVEVVSFIDMPDNVYSQIAERTWNPDKKDGTVSFENRKWLYRISDLNSKVVIIGNEQQALFPDNVHYKIDFLDITDSSKTLTQLLITFVIVGMVVLIIFFGVSFHFANRSIRPIEENWQKQKQFVADASHELKTPLAIISANTDALLANREESVNSQKKWIDYIQSETGRMGKLVNDMLYLAKVEDTRENQSPFDISNTVMDVIASMEAVVFEKGIRLTQTIERGVIVKGDGEKIKQAVLILLDNAVKYTDNGGTVAIRLKTAKSHAVFSVENSGEPIPEDKLPKIFDRFYRSDPSRSQETGGFGLGLAIAKTIIERSGGSIHAKTTNNSTIFTFELKIS
ncbi:Signal transduction histidine kinase [Evansella caseinilytica]|uniref:histidine kinase n=1 Tax=Evansella caseinilytica TaxID=1503961 RepID=A0A1H3Q4Y2_9BACI|nr:HAMP domain-containing sensor histidine kinase [Evansella caseinilytica]SDZ08231.1 Signal transduction histidine kinase [Evansella caseinilytica]